MKHLDAIKSALSKIPTNDEFLANQALTVKIELILRDYIHYYLTKDGIISKEEVKGAGKSNRSSSDLAIFNNKEYSPENIDLLIELKQYYTDDIIYSEKLATDVLRATTSDIEKYPEDYDVISILFLIHFDCTKEAFDKHGQQFTYYDGFLKIRDTYNYNTSNMLEDSKERLYQLVKDDFKTYEIFDFINIELGKYADIGVSSQVVFTKRK